MTHLNDESNQMNPLNKIPLAKVLEVHGEEIWKLAMYLHKCVKYPALSDFYVTVKVWLLY